MDILLVILYVLVFSFFIWHPRLFKSGGSKPFLLSVFLIKCLLGIFYTYIHIQKYGGGDTLAYFNDANIIYNALLVNPFHYLQLTFGPNGGEPPDNISAYIQAMGYWGDSNAYMVVRFNALVHIFSLGNFYVHGIFMSFISLIGLYLLYRSIDVAVGIPNSWVKWGIFLFPSVLFWTSGVHKEGLLIFDLGLFFYSVSCFNQKHQIRYLIFVFLSSALIYFTRDFLLLLLIPGLIAYLISLRSPRYSLVIFLMVYLFLGLGGTLLYTFQGMNYLEMIAYRQNLFRALASGNTHISIDVFHPSLKSLLLEMPQALFNSLLGPFIIKIKSPLHWLAFIENVLIGLMILLALIFTPYRKFKTHPLFVWYLFFAFSLLLLIGYIVPNVGAIVRYRSLCWPFLFTFLFFNIDFGKFSKTSR